MVVIIPLTRNNAQIPVDFFLQDQSQNAVDLTNTSCVFKMSLPGSLIDSVNDNMTLTSAAGGIVRETFVMVDLANNGQYNGSITATYAVGNASGRIISTGDGQIIVNVGAAQP